MLADDVVGALVASFTALRISDAFAADEYPSEVLSYSFSPYPSVVAFPPGRWTSM